MILRAFKKYLLAFCCLLMFCSLLKQYYTVFQLGTIQNRHSGLRRTNVVVSSKQWCQFPKLDMADPSVMQYFSVQQPLNCSKREKNWVYIRNGTFYIDSEAEVRHGGKITCDYSDIRYLGERTVDIKPKEKFQNGSKLKDDFFKVDCQIDGTNITYSNYHAGVVRLEKVIERSKSKSMPPNALNLNVYMFGFDSTSRLGLMRNLPKMYNYLTENMDAIVLEGYNILGDGTLKALIPMLTDRKEEEWPSTLKGDPNANYVDVYKFVWDDYRNAGYVTSWSEDIGDGHGTFDYYMKGFKKQPTDHSMLNYYTATHHLFPGKCAGSNEHHRVHFDYVQHLWETYPIDTPKFVFQFHSIYSHDHFTELQFADDYMVDHLKFFVDNGHLNNTIIIAMTDHGSRYGSDVRATGQGKLEERLPFFSFVFPPWFKNRYPETFRVFKENAARLTTPFDIYPTLQEILNFDPNPKPSRVKNRSLSLFHPIPIDRTCRQAEIDVHWCTCLQWTEVQIDDFVRSIAIDLVKTINEKTHGYRNLCAEIKLSKINKALNYTPSTELLKVIGTNFQRNLELSDQPAMFHLEYYQLDLWTEPGNAHYEASITWNTVTKISTIDLGSVSHINRYGDQPHCIVQKAPSLVKFCKCYDKL